MQTYPFPELFAKHSQQFGQDKQAELEFPKGLY
jgi:hypothetical protein